MLFFTKEDDNTTIVNLYYQGPKLRENIDYEKYSKEYVKSNFSIYQSKKGGITSSGNSIGKFGVDCSSNYLYISLLSLMVLLL